MKSPLEKGDTGGCNFNEAKYKALLEGLEISEVLYSRMLNHTISTRLDSEYFKKEYLIQDNKLASKEIGKLSKLTTKIDVGFVGAMTAYYRDEGIILLQTKNISEFFINDNDSIRITEPFHKKLKKSQINFEDILIARSGSFGKASIYLEKATINSSDIIIIQANEVFINPYYLTGFLNSKYGVSQMIRFASGGLQGHVNLTILEELEVPILKNGFQENIKNIISNSYQLKTKSKQTYSQAETLLLEAVGLQNFQPGTEKVNVKSFKDSFITTGRLDAEYYQVKYEDYSKLIQSYKNGYEPLKTACILKDANFNPDETIEYKYIELADIGKTGEIKGCTTALGNELPSRARRRVNTGDVIVSSIEGSLESCALVQKEYNNALCSTGFYVINSKKINSETLLVLFKSESMQNILKQACSGTILTAINKDEFINIPVPIIKTSVQQQISELVEESFRLKKESESLLELAKRAVEMAIEEGEERGMEMIKQI
ncbi:MAG: restriction endonuclease subunit S [Bacteroidota bacterium]